VVEGEADAREVGRPAGMIDVCRRDRPQLAACLAYLRPGGVLVVEKLDRLGRSSPTSSTP
jgi:DNA invertase Pin-like site-specific DNA recombinase